MARDARSIDCPPTEVLEEFGRGTLEATEKDRVAHHLDECPECRGTIRSKEMESTRGFTPGGPLFPPMASTVEIIEPTTEAQAPTRSKQAETAETVPAQKPTQPESPSSGDKTSVGRYRFLKRLGSGSFGTVYLGHDPDLDRRVAIKLSHRDRIRKPEDVQQYLEEARSLATLDHPHVLPVFDVGQEDGSCYLVTKYVEGTDLSHLMTDSPVSQAEAARLIIQVADGLEHAHRHGLIHRDIKPANILIATDGHPYLADFGLAVRDLGDDRPIIHGGTPQYMSPEQARGEGHRIDARSDIYSLGVVFYRLLTGRRPYRSDSVPELLREIVRTEISPPIEVNPGISVGLDRVCRKMMEKLATERYQTAVDVVEDLRRWENGADETRSSLPKTPVPKGLRSFGPLDADAFLDLLPGPVDRAGLPESVGFWKRRVEATDEEAFPVGLLLGSSGSGKSSLIAAGLVPRLARHVVAINVDCARGQVAARLAASVRSACPGLSQKLSLREVLASVRRGGIGNGRRKILLVLDQFEQHLATAREPLEAEVADSLRQCDGIRLQALLIARDDFAMAAWRFFESLEIPLVQGRNFGTVDRFSPEHARKVLISFGRAYGQLPQAPAEPTADHRAFLDRAIAELVVSDDVAPVRLAVFAEMVRDRPWTRGTLRAGGGVEGIGVDFLDGLFTSPTAHPRLKALAEPSRALLKALLPPLGSTIRGGSRSLEELKQAVGPELDAPTFLELRTLLDAEARLITTIESEVDNDRAGSSPRIQLTHDYLVPSLRAWLTMKQGETSRGRAELRLAERARGWSLHPSPRQLPGLAETASILVQTRRGRWEASERKVIRAAVRHHGSRVLAGSVVVFASLGLILAGIRRLESRNLDSEAKGVVARLFDSDPSRVPGIVREVEARKLRTGSIIDRESRKPGASDRLRRRAAIGVLGSRPDLAGFLAEESTRPDLELDETLLLRSVLTLRAADVSGALWAVVEAPEVQAGRRFRAALTLAGLDGSNPAWPRNAGFVVDQWLATNLANPAQYATLLEAFRPIRSSLIPRLLEASRSGPGERRASAFNILADYAKDDPETLVRLVTEAEPRRIGELMPNLKRIGARSVERLERVLDERLELRFDEPGIHPIEPAPSTLASLQQADGWAAPRFAICQTLPIGGLKALNEAMSQASYRPIRVRPYADDRTTRVAALWTRDLREWRLEVNLSAADASARLGALAGEGFEAIDVASYLASTLFSTSERYAIVWVRAQAGSAARQVDFGLDDVAFEARAKRLIEDQFVQLTHHVLDLKPGQAQGQVRRHAAIWVRTEDDTRFLVGTRFDASSGEYSGDLYPGLLEVDVSLGKTGPRPNLAERMEAKLARTEALLAALPEDCKEPNLIFDRGYVQFRLKHDDQALADWNGLIARYPAHAWMWKMPRLMLHARRGDLDKARADLADYLVEKRNRDEGKKAYLQAYVDAQSGDSAGAVRRLNKQASEHLGDPSYLYSIANGLAVIADLAAKQGKPEARDYADRAIDTLELAVKAGLKVTTEVRDDPDFESIEQHPRFLAIMDQAKLDIRYTALWRSEPLEESVEVHNLSTLDHIAKSRDLAAQGFRPASIAAYRPSTGREILNASVWHRPRPSDPDRQRLADRQASAAVALIQLGRDAKVWPLLVFQPDPRLATEIQHRLAPGGVDPSILAGRLEVEPDADVRRVLILALGLYPSPQVGEPLRRSLLDRLAKLFQTDPDPGVHSASEWVIRKWEPDAYPTLQRDLVATRAEPRGHSGWFVNRSGDTFAIVEPGTFEMGARPGQTGRSSRYVDRLHRRTIPRRFAIATKEVTNRQFALFLAANPRWSQHSTSIFSKTMKPDPDNPAINVSMPMALAYCRWLTEAEGMAPDQQCFGDGDLVEGQSFTYPQGYLARSGYRLPTEAEWEYAERAGTTTFRPSGGDDGLLSHYGRFRAEDSGLTTGSDRPWPVGGLLPGRSGGFDFLGNAAEWTLSRYDLYPTPGPGQSADDPEILSTHKPKQFFVTRGGSFNLLGHQLSSAARYPVDPLFAGVEAGFRIVRTLPD